ncbi:alpha/beta hydrolase [SAR202 cluster bacterium AD-802-E10_MRT_200m]|nr:alpha/beta hydrolase [SAR202 cluster bacterium AD-802-E10_MRT_200m]
MDSVNCDERQDTSYDIMEITTDDGVVLCGRLFGEGDSAVILSHMNDVDQEGWREFAVTLASHRYTAVTFNFRGHSPSEGLKADLDSESDLNAVLKDVTAMGFRDIYLFGAGIGASASVKVAAKEKVSGVVTISPSLEHGGLDAVQQVSNVNSPILIIVSEDDYQGRDLATKYFENAPQTRLLEIFTGDSRGTDILIGRNGENLRTRLLEFLKVFAP